MSTDVKAKMTACKLSFKWFGTSKALDQSQTSQAAETFDADGKMLSARKKLLDTKTKAWRELTALKSEIATFWKEWTTPYPDPGVRLIKKDDVQHFDDVMKDRRARLLIAVKDLNNNHYLALRSAAEERLGTLFNPDDYPPSILDQFDVSWEFPSVDPPMDLKSIAPAIYEAEQKKAEAKLMEAVALAEQAFATEFAQMIVHLTERLTPEADGKKKVFRDSAITNLNDFFARFEKLKLGDNTQLEGLIGQAKKMMAGIEPKDVRKSEGLQTDLAQTFGKMAQTLEGMIVKAPRRKIVVPEAEAA